MPTREDHAHTVQSGDMIRCTVCHRQWQTSELDADIPPCEPADSEGTKPVDRLPRKQTGWRGPGHRGRR